MRVRVWNSPLSARRDLRVLGELKQLLKHLLLLPGVGETTWRVSNSGVVMLLGLGRDAAGEQLLELPRVNRLLKHLWPETDVYGTMKVSAWECVQAYG